MANGNEDLTARMDAMATHMDAMAIRMDKMSSKIDALIKAMGGMYLRLFPELSASIILS